MGGVTEQHKLKKCKQWCQYECQHINNFKRLEQYKACFDVEQESKKSEDKTKVERKLIKSVMIAKWFPSIDVRSIARKMIEFVMMARCLTDIFPPQVERKIIKSVMTAKYFLLRDVRSITRTMIESVIMARYFPDIFLPLTNYKVFKMGKYVSGSYLPSTNKEMMIDFTSYTHDVQRQESHCSLRAPETVSAPKFFDVSSTKFLVVLTFASNSSYDTDDTFDGVVTKHVCLVDDVTYINGVANIERVIQNFIQITWGYRFVKTSSFQWY